MKALIIIACCLALAFVLSAIERLRVFISRDKIMLDDPENLKDSLILLLYGKSHIERMRYKNHRPGSGDLTGSDAPARLSA